ncbi:MAG: ABC transporter permease [Pseudomonadota bacterium]
MRASYATNQFWRGLQVQRSVIFALFMKEYKVRLDGSRFGLIWTLIEPIAYVLILSSLWFSLGKTEISGIPIFLFVGIGMFALKFYQSCLNAIALGIRQNLNLLDYPNVKPIDAILARFLLEGLLTIVAGIITFGGLYWIGGYAVEVRNFPLFFATFGLALVSAFGLALLSGVYRTLNEGIHRAVPIFSAPLIFVSAVFYPLSILPYQLQYWLSWNPIVQVNELMRIALFGAAQQRDVDLNYLFLFAIYACFLGTISYFANRFKLLKR